MQPAGACGQHWISDNAIRCSATSVATGEPCLAHHSDRQRLLEDHYTSSGGPTDIDLARAEIDTALCELIVELNSKMAVALNCSFAHAHFVDVAWFQDAVFNGDADFGGATFHHAADFSGATFHAAAVFENVSFEHRATFDGAVFREDARFSSVRFADTTFVGTRFEADARFDLAEFADYIVFDRSEFARLALFGGELHGWARFTAARFDGLLVFDHLTINDVVSFVRATFSARTEIDSTSGPGEIRLKSIRFSHDSPIIQLGPTPTHLQDLYLDRALTLTSPNLTFGLRSITGCTLTKPLIIDSGVKLKHTRFVGTVGLDQLRLRADPLWPKTTRRLFSAPRRVTTRQIISDELHIGQPLARGQMMDDAQLELVYRQLRASLESSKAHAGANDFYYGELDARRRWSHRWSVERVLLGGYRIMLGYGVRASRPLAWWVATIIALTAAFDLRTDELLTPNPPAPRSLHVEHWGQALAFVLQNSTNLLRTIDSGLEWDGTLLLLVGRFTTVTLLAGVFLALRSRVTR